MTLRLTQSVLSSAEDCMLKAQYTLDRPEWAQRVAGSNRALGTGWHAGMELLYVARKFGQAQPTVDDMIGKAIEVFDLSLSVDLYDDTPVEQVKWDDNVPDHATAHSHLDKMVRFYMDNGHAWPQDWRVLDVEANVTLDDDRLGKVKLGADLVLQASDGGIVLCDHKTAGKPWVEGKAHPRKNVQSPFYLRLARRIWPYAPYYRFVFDVITLPRPKAGISFQRIISDPQEKHEEAIVRRAEAVLATYQAIHVDLGRDLPANPNSTLCNGKYCDFFDGCSFGRQLELN